MKANQIKAGGHYTAKVSGVLTTVRVDEVTDDRWPGRTRGGTRYHVTNLRTGRKTVFRSPQKFRAEVSSARVVAGTFHTPASETTNHPDYRQDSGGNLPAFFDDAGRTTCSLCGGDECDCHETVTGFPAHCSRD